MFQQICCAYDGSPGAQRALDATLLLAREQTAQVRVLIVREAPPQYAATVGEVEEDRELSDRYVATLTAAVAQRAAEQTVPVETIVRAGHPAQGIVLYLEESHTDLLVIGQSGHSEIWGRFLGSTVDKVIRHAPCSVLVVRGKA